MSGLVYSTFITFVFWCFTTNSQTLLYTFEQIHQQKNVKLRDKNHFYVHQNKEARQLLVLLQS